MFRNIFVLSDVVGAVERLFLGVRDSDPLGPRPWTRFYEVGRERSYTRLRTLVLSRCYPLCGEPGNP